MAAITPVVTALNYPNKGCHKIVWETLTTTNTLGTGVQLPVSNDKTVSAVGTFGAALIFAIEGSNDSTNGTDGTWYNLADPQGTVIALNVTGEMEVVLENPLWIRPNRVSGGDGSSDVDVIITTRGAK
jgi:hypothetical protein